MIGRLLDKWFPRREASGRWEAEADQAGIEQEPLRARALLYGAGLILMVLLAWAAWAELEEVTRGEGRVIPSRQVQIVQAVDGGVVSEILTKEGQEVAAGELLLRIDPTRFASSLRENQGQYLALAAKTERLKALSEKRSFRPARELVAEAPDLVEREEHLYQSTLKELDTQVEIARQQLKQRNEELNEAGANRDQLSRRLELLEQELAVTGPMVKTGAVSQVELLRLERDVIQTRGERDRTLAQIDRLQAAIAEGNRKIQEVELSFANRIRRELSETLAKLNSLSEEKTTLADRVKHAEVKAPLRGTVKRLFVNTQGAVVQQGQEVAEIVPADDALVLEVKVSPRDIAFLGPGQKAQVRFTAYDYAVYGGLEAVVDRIGADTVVDDRGNAFYLVRVHTLRPDFGENLPIIPGMTAQVDIVTGKKTLLAYLFKPILQTGALALRER